METKSGAGEKRPVPDKKTLKRSVDDAELDVDEVVEARESKKAKVSVEPANTDNNDKPSTPSKQQVIIDLTEDSPSLNEQQSTIESAHDSDRLVASAEHHAPTTAAADDNGTADSTPPSSGNSKSSEQESQPAAAPAQSSSKADDKEASASSAPAADNAGKITESASAPAVKPVKISLAEYLRRKGIKPAGSSKSQDTTDINKTVQISSD
jgi:hypothetical protein